MYELEIKTDLKGILERVPPQKVWARLAKIFFTFIWQFHKVGGDLKRLYNGFQKWNIVFSVQVCI